MAESVLGGLEGVRVLDLAGEMGVYATKLLAELGANVLKVEPPGGDPTRRIGPFAGGAPDSEGSLLFWNENTDKRSAVLDLDAAEGQETFRRLAGVADILVETLPVGYLAERGLGQDTLQAANPRLIHVAISGFGQTGPYRDFKSPEIVGWAMSGFMSRCGDPDRAPLIAGADPGRHVAGIYGAIGALAALERRSRTGRGAFIDVSMQESIASITEAVQLSYIHSGQITRRAGSEYPLAVPLKIFPCADGHVLVVTVTLGQWQKLVELMLSDDAAEDLIDPRWEDNLLRIAEKDHIHGVVGRWVAGKSKQEFVAYAQENRLPFAVVNSVADAATDPQLEALDFYVEAEHPDTGKTYRYPGTPARIGRAGQRRVTTAPRLGEGQSVIDEWLGQTPDPGAAGAKSGGDAFLPLAGLRVLDFTWAAAGPFAAKTLADLGADVVKVEQRDIGDIIRGFPPFPNGQKEVNGSGYHYQINRNKRTLCADIRSAAGKDLLRRLASRANIVIDNFSAGVLDRAGLGYDELRKLNPKVIVMHLPAFGEVGPRRNFVGFAPTIESFSGLSALTGYPDRDPSGMGTALPDYWGGLSGALASLAALARLDRSGEGERIVAPMFASNTSILGPVMLDYTVNGNVQTPNGNRRQDRPAAPHGMYRCAGEDCWIAIAVETDEEWRALRRVMGDPDWARDERFSSAEGRFANQDDLDRQVESWTVRQESRDLMVSLQAAGVPAGMFQNGQDLVDGDPHLAARGFYVDVEFPGFKGKRLDRSPLLFEGQPLPIRRRAPLLMENAEDVITEWLGVDESEAALLAALAVAGDE